MNFAFLLVLSAIALSNIHSVILIRIINVNEEKITFSSLFQFLPPHNKLVLSINKIEQFYVTKKGKLKMVHDGKNLDIFNLGKHEALNTERLLEKYIGLQDYKISNDEIVKKKEKKNQKVVTTDFWNKSLDNISQLKIKDIITVMDEDYEVYQHFKCQWKNQSQSVINHLTNPNHEILLYYNRSMYENIYAIEIKIPFYKFDYNDILHDLAIDFDYRDILLDLSIDDYPNRFFIDEEEYTKEYLNSGTFTSTISPHGVAAEQAVYFNDDQSKYLRFFKINGSSISFFKGEKINNDLIKLYS
ncbi:hypothetical protein [Flammeovirga kamogawensis]|nr:hypothetical protein [Flammeovirga kamogawensis]MBB6460513.1 hypothetical protein [Flammeovirga kamogawensis]